LRRHAQLEFAMIRTILVTTFAVAALLAAPSQLYAQRSSEHAGQPAHKAAAATSVEAHHDGAQAPTSKADIDALVAKMNAATGAAKIDAVAEVLTALVQEKKDCEAKMAGMMTRMGSEPEKPADPHAAH